MTAAIQVLAALLTAENILLDADVNSKQELFALIDRLLSGTASFAPHAWEKNLQAREQLGSTAIGQGVAIPHARIRGLDRVIAAFVRARKPIAFDAPDGKPVTHIVAIFVPEQATQAHLQLLAGVAELFSDARFREALDRCTSAAGVMSLIADWSAK